MDFELEIQNTRKDYLNFLKYYYLKKTAFPKIYFSVLFGIAIYVSDLFTFENNSDMVKLLLSLLVAIIFLLLLTFIPYLIALRSFLALITSKKSPLGDKKITIADSGIQVDSNSENVIWNWTSVSSAGNTDQFVYILLSNQRLYILPYESFRSFKEFNSLVGFIENKIISRYGTGRRTDVKTLYLWGLLGLLPPIGIITGLIYIYRGIFEYKDKYLIIIGLLSILYTIGYYYFFQ